MATKESTGGIGFSGALTLLFVGLRLTSVIDWSWWWVLSPTLIHLFLIAVSATLIALFAPEGK